MPVQLDVARLGDGLPGRVLKQGEFMNLKTHIPVQVRKKEAQEFKKFCRKNDLKIRAAAADAFALFMQQYEQRTK